MIPYQVVSVILAAGESKRMGFPKPLLKYQGKSFLRRIIETHQAARLLPYVVLGHHREEIQRRTDLSEVTVVVNPDPGCSQLSSLQSALRELDHSSALILHPVDHPLVKSDSLAALVECHRRVPHCIIVPEFCGQKGHPVLFPSRFYPDLRLAPLSQGARGVVRRNLASILYLPVGDQGILHNIDTPDQFQELQLKLDSNLNKTIWGI